MVRGLLGAAMFAVTILGGAVHASEDFTAMLERAQSMDHSVDFAALRLAYISSPGYSPIDVHFNVKGREMRQALESADYSAVIDAGEAALDGYPLDPTTHLVLAHARRETGSPDRADVHKFMAERLLLSILQSGDGLKPETAFMVTGRREIESLLRILGLERVGAERLMADSTVIEKVYVRTRKSEDVRVVHFGML